ncbi:MAG: VCBS repeat-containing protein, partial [Blastocatellia bacterium]|nr:VCBS repeat-containing protein [Blastocatellia bacterium]
MRKIYNYSLLIIAGLILIDTIANNRIPRINAQTILPPPLAQLSSDAVIHSAEQGKPWINLSAGRELLTTFSANETASLTAGGAHPLALASADFDEDGVPDLVSGYALPNSLTLHRGNADAIYPYSPEAKQRKAAGQFTDAPFLLPAQVFTVPEAPDFIGTGDFNADGHQDVVLVARGSQTLYGLAGNGKGGFAAPQRQTLPGNVTALVTGEINRADGLTDLVVGIVGETGPKALVFEGPDGALQREPETLSLPAPATDFSIGQLDNAYPFDLAIAAGNQLLIVHGRDRQLPLDNDKNSEVAPASIQRQLFTHKIEALAVGNFAGSNADDIALLDVEGTLSLLTSDHQANSRQWGTMTGQMRMNKADRLATANALTTPRLIRVQVSSRPVDDLLVLQFQHLNIVMGESLSGANAANVQAPVIPSYPIALDLEDQPIAALPMRLNTDNLNDLVILNRGKTNPVTIVESVPVRTFTVNSILLSPDANPGDGVCAIASSLGGGCTLPAAIEEANASAGADLINFSSSVRQLDKFYRNTIAETVTIDAAASGGVTLDGGGAAGSGVFTLSYQVTNCLIRGFAFYGYYNINSLDGIINVLGNGHTIEGNFFGLDITGTQARLTPGSDYIRVEGKNLTVGGTTVAARNYFAAGNNPNIASGTAIDILGSEAKVLGNYFGTDITGQTLLADQGYRNAIDVFSANNVIGGIEGTVAGRCAGPCNLLSLKGRAIYVSSGAGNLVQGNFMGTDVTGTNLLRNNSGVVILASNTTIGGTVDRAGNIIAGANLGQGYGTGVRVEQGTGNKILRNSMFTNYNLGIELLPLGVTPNDAGDSDTGANELQNYPVLSAASGGAATGTLNSKPNTNYTIEFFSNTTCHSSGNGEGEKFLQAISVTTDVQGNATFAVPVGQNITATATDPAGNTSEFSACLAASVGKQLSVDPESLSFSGTFGQSNPPAKTFTLKNISAATLTWQATATTTAGGNWLSVTPPSGSLNAGQSLTVSAAVDISNVWADLYSGTVSFATTTPGSSPTPLEVALTVGCPLEGSLAGEADVPNCNDVLTIGLFEPPVGEYTVDELKTKLFKANVTYLLQSKKEASLVLRIFDQNGNRLGSSTILDVKRPVPPPGATTNVDLQIAGSSLFYDLKPCVLNMYALFIDSSGNVIKRSKEISYVVKGENCGDSIEMRNPLFDGELAATAKIYTGSTVEYKCDIRYNVLSDPKGGVVALQAFDMTSGAAKAISNIVLVPVDKTTEPKLLTGEKITVNIPSDTSLIQVRAVLLDSSGVTIVTKHFVDYTPIQIKIELGDYVSPFPPFDPPLVLIGGGRARDDIAIKVTPSLDTKFNQAIPLISIYANDNLLALARPPVIDTLEPLPNPIYLLPLKRLLSTVPDNADQLLIQLKYIFTTNNKIVSSNLVPIPIDRVKIITKSSVPNFPSSATILKPGRTEKFGFWLEYNMKRPGVNELQAVVECTTPSGLNIQTIKPALKPSGERFEFDVTIPSDAQDLAVYFRLSNQTDPDIAYSKSVYCKNMDKVSLTLPSGVGQVISNTLGVNLNTVQNAVDRAVDAVRTLGNLGAIAGSKPKSFALEETSELAEQNATIAAMFGNYLLVNSYWSFTPAIPADGTFLADLTLQYNPTDLPDDPAFNPANLKVIAYDPATGAVEAYPSNVNLTARTVTARLNRLAPYYTLGVENPLTARALDFPVLRQFSNFNSTLMLLNTGSTTAALTTRAYAVDGTLYSGQGVTNPASVSLPASQLISTTADNLFKLTNGVNGGWVQASANQRSVLGYEMIGKDNRLDGLSVQIVHPGSFVVSNIERSAAWETEIHLANVTAFIGTVALELRDANGAVVGTWEQVMLPHSAYSAQISELFPTVPATFNGYLLGQSDQPMNVAVLLTSADELVALNAQSWQAENTPATLYLPYAAFEPGFFTSKLNLVNPTASTATLKLRLRDEEGKELTAPVNLTLQPGQQYQRSLNQIFSVNNGFEGAVTMESNITGVVGEVEYNDPSAVTTFRTMLPLLSTPTTAYVFPHIDTGVDTLTQLAVFNPNAQPVQVEVKVFRPDGTSNGSAKISLAANAFFSEWIDELILTSFNMNGGYFTVTADLPICAGAIFGTLEGTMMAALPGQPLAATIIGSVASVSAASYVAGTEIAVDSIVSAFGTNLATNTQPGLSLPLPTALQ